jgi:biopolymer transport protein ExbD
MDLRKRRREEAKVESSALNDILFIFLLFFLIVSTLANPNVIKLSLPRAESNTKAKQTVVVSIDAQQRYYVGTTQVPFDQLLQVLAPRLASEQVDATIVINADKTVPIDDVVKVMEIARQLHAKVVLATAHPDAGTAHP